MMRTKLVVGNWKLNLTQAEASALVSELVKSPLKSGVEIGICPTYVTLAAVKPLLEGTPVQLGAQDVFWKDSGAFTGRISAPLLKDAGVKLCVVGHSETRGKFGKLETPEETVPFFAETDFTVNLKIKALLANDIVPILCVGETLGEREAGKTDEIIKEQLKGGLVGVDFSSGVVAYEPVWAIGTGKVCESAEASRVCGMIRSTLAEILGAEVAEKVRVLYGGSVNPSNSAELFAKPDIDGGLVGGASLKAEQFTAIIASA